MSANNVTASEFYRVLVPHQPWLALTHGEINLLQFCILFSLHRRVMEWDTGRISSFSAEQVILELKHTGLIKGRSFKQQQRNVENQMALLRKAGWFHWDYKEGSHRPYNIWLHNWVACQQDSIYSFILASSYFGDVSPQKAGVNYADGVPEYRIINPCEIKPCINRRAKPDVQNYDEGHAQNYDEGTRHQITTNKMQECSIAAQAQDNDEDPAGHPPSQAMAPYSVSQGENNQPNDKAAVRVNQDDAFQDAIDEITKHVSEYVSDNMKHCVVPNANRCIGAMLRLKDNFSPQEIMDGFDRFLHEQGEKRSNVTLYFKEGAPLLRTLREERLQAPIIAAQKLKAERAAAERNAQDQKLRQQRDAEEKQKQARAKYESRYNSWHSAWTQMYVRLDLSDADLMDWLTRSGQIAESDEYPNRVADEIRDGLQRHQDLLHEDTERHRLAAEDAERQRLAAEEEHAHKLSAATAFLRAALQDGVDHFADAVRADAGILGIECNILDEAIETAGVIVLNGEMGMFTRNQRWQLPQAVGAAKSE